MTIKVLKRQRVPLKQIARDTGCSRNTVKKYLQQDDSTPGYTPRPKRVSKLDPFKDYIHSRINAAHPDWIPAAVLYEEILRRGYTGKIRMVSDYVAGFKPKSLHEPLIRFETPPGQQMQVDFTTIRRNATPLKAFVATLGYSRASYVRFYEHERTDAWIDGLVRSFEFFGGVPKEVLFDNAKAIILERDAYAKGEHRFNPSLLSLAQAYGFKPRVCRPYRAKTKGKVERFNRYLKASFVIPLQATFTTAGLSLDAYTINGYTGAWLTGTANARVHATTHEVPNARLIPEQQALLPLPVMPMPICHGNHISSTGHNTQPSTAQRVPIPLESLQHPLSRYDQLIGGRHEFTI